MKPRFPDGIPFVLGVATGLAALSFYYVAPGGWSGAHTVNGHVALVGVAFLALAFGVPFILVSTFGLAGIALALLLGGLWVIFLLIGVLALIASIFMRAKGGRA
ncbi:MAG: hypothetical protein KGI38_11410 [Thaumarchaeota archaeon]|nr:hypothetical protein [Nitrososphaerota archaeon]